MPAIKTRASLLDHPQAHAMWKAVAVRIRGELRASGVLGAAWLVRRMPRPLAYGLAQRAGDLVYWAWGARRQAALTAMRHALGPAAPSRRVARCARASFGYYACSLVDLLRGPDRASAPTWASGPHGAGAEVLEARAGGRGLILVGVHQGSWDRAALALHARGLPVVAVADPIVPPRLHRCIAAIRRRYGVTLVSPTPAGLRTICRVLAANGVVALLIDHAAPDHGVRVRLFGAPICLPSGPARLALRTGAALAVATCIRYPDRGHFRLTLGPLISTAAWQEADAGAAVVAITQTLATALEALIRQDPAQWYVFRPFWPPDEGGN